jgi:predicted small lipoprotein YifL
MSRKTTIEMPKIWFVATRVALMLVVALALTGCGRKGNPQPPPGEQNQYPRTYPST